MKIYFLDTNSLLRYVLEDNPIQFRKIKKYFIKAKAGQITLVVIPEIIIEAEHVLQKFYKFAKPDILKATKILIESSALEVRDRTVMLQALNLYKNLSIDLVDTYLFALSKSQGAEVFSFDKDFCKLK